MRAISVLSFETGTSTRWCLAAAALRRRVRKSAIGSVCIFLLMGSYQLAFTTPGISPLSAIPRKQILHIWNLRIYPRARPQQRQRLRTRTLNFGFLSDLAIFAVRAIYCATPFSRNGNPSPLSSSRPCSSFFALVVMPMVMPLRILKFAMDFFARVITAFCPVIWPSSTAAVSSSFAFWLASPRPMLTVIFLSLGTAIMFFHPNRFISAGTVSVRYFSCNRLFIAFFYLVLYLSNVVLQCRQLRTFVPSGSTVWPIRVCLPQLPQTTITFETLIPASFSTIPPLMFFEGLGRVCRLMMPTCSTTTVFFFALIERTRPLFPASFPAITLTLSPLRI